MLDGAELIDVLEVYTNFDSNLDPFNPANPLTQPQQGLIGQQDAFLFGGENAFQGTGLAGLFDPQIATLDASLGAFNLYQNIDHVAQVEGKWSNQIIAEADLDVSFDAVSQIVAAHNLIGLNPILTWEQYLALNPSDAEALILEQTGYVPHFDVRFFDGFSKTINVPVTNIDLDAVLPINFADLTIDNLVGNLGYSLIDDVKIDLAISDQILEEEEEHVVIVAMLPPVKQVHQLLLRERHHISERQRPLVQRGLLLIQIEHRYQKLVHGVEGVITGAIAVDQLHIPR